LRSVSGIIKLAMASRAAERARIAPPFQASDDLDPKHIKFMQSSQSRGVKINAVAPSRLPGRGLGIVATSKIKRGTSVLFVPEKAMFKPDREFLRQNNLSSASPQAQLAISVMAACLASGPEDEMAIWDATWPTDDDFQHSLPFRWPEAWHALLPAGAQQPLRRQIRDWEVDLAAVGPVLELNKWQEGDFLYYWCIVNSRSFHWKPSGGRNRGGKGKNGPLVKGEMVMCPFIDYLNHGPSGTTCEVFEREGGYEVIADRDYGKCYIFRLLCPCYVISCATHFPCVASPFFSAGMSAPFHHPWFRKSQATEAETDNLQSLAKNS